MKKFVRRSNKCMICGDRKLTRYLSLGRSALANSYLTKYQLKKPELKVPLEVYFCHNCYSAQLRHIVDRSLIYSKYAYFSSTSPMLVKHFEEYANEVFSRFPEQARRLVVDVGSNDGVLLKPFKSLGARVLGIDPARNIAKIANEQGIETLPAFFRKDLVSKLVKKYGKAGVITSNNTLAHTDILHDILDGVKSFLSDDGVFVFEVQYLVDLLKHNEFDNTYHEHIFYHSIHPLSTLLKKHSMGIFDIIHTDTHGGAVMVFASHFPLPFKAKKSVQKFLDEERVLGLHRLAAYRKFANRPPLVKKNLRKILLNLKRDGKKIVGYGASAKGTTLLQYCEIGPDVISYVTDSAPSKQGKYTPGTHIPIVAPEVLKDKKPDYILVLAWNYAKNIMEKEDWFKKDGGKFIIPIPQPVII